MPNDCKQQRTEPKLSPHSLGSTLVVPNDVLGHMLLSAFRYALGRSTYITQETRAWMEAYWPLLERWHQQIHDAIRRAIDLDAAGMACDIEEWHKVLALPIAKGRMGS